MPRSIRLFRVRAAIAVVAACLSTLFVLRASAATPKDAEALKLREKAIYTDYLGTDFAAAEAKLSQALALCGDGADCRPAVRARLECDLGAVFFSDKNEADAKTHFLRAMKDDPAVTIDKDLATPELQRAFASVKTSGSPEKTGPAPAAPAAEEEDLSLTAPPAQAQMTPIPIFVRLPESVEATKVSVRYKPFGATQWKTLALRNMDSGWGGEIPCADVGDSPGDLKYFAHATDRNGDLVAASGRLVAPHVVHIVAELEAEAPHLPGKPPAARCTQNTDCPPGFPGCHSESGTTACVSDDDCSGGQTCDGGFCVGETVTVAADAPFKENWVTLAFQADLMVLPYAADACRGGTGYTCFSGGSYYSGIPVEGADDIVAGGVAPATMRVLLGYDRVFGQNIMLGGRVGYAFNGGPQRPGGSAFLPVHVEARGTYWFGHDPLGRSGLRFYGLAGVGAEEVDAAVTIDVYATPADYPKQSTNYNAWKKTGLGFADAGAGAMYGFTPNSGVLLEAKAVALFPTAGFGANLQVGYMIGL